MTSTDEDCNLGMFQSDTIEYGPTPAEYSTLNLGDSCYLGSGEFPDALADGAEFRYLLTCYLNQINLSRVYATSPYGSPFRDGILYSWVTGTEGNSCDPFDMTDGQPLPGTSCPTLNVTLEGT